jgi:acetyltransferase-like isoleucine patch superfamily enzyme
VASLQTKPDSAVRAWALGTGCQFSIGSRMAISRDVHLFGTHDYTDPRYPLVRRAVVMSDVPPWKVVAGNPARVIKDRVLRR